MRADTKAHKTESTKKKSSMWSIFGPVLALLLCAIVLILSKFYRFTVSEARKDVREQVTSEVYANVQEAPLVLGQIMAAGNVASNMLSDKGVDYKIWSKTAKDILISNDYFYLTSIVNVDGIGVSSNSDEMISLSGYSYYKEQDEAYYKIVGVDGITGNPALVCVVPISDENGIYGYVNLYMDKSALSNMFSLDVNNSNNGLIVMKKTGDVIFKKGFSPVAVDTNLFEFLSNSEILDNHYSTVVNNTNNNEIHHYELRSDNKDYFFVSVPMGVGGWTCVYTTEIGYIDKLVDKKVSEEKNMIKSLVLLCLVTGFVVFLGYIAIRARQRQTNKALENKAETDLLTGLTNKIATERKIEEILLDESDSQHLLILFDIDNFKKINDTMGHAFGDTVLKSLGEQLSQEFRKTDVLGRTGGDEFTLLIKDLKTDEIIKKEGDKLISFFSQFKAGEYVKYSATASIGAAIYPRDGKDFASLYKAADHALYEAKKQGKNRLIYYNENLKESSKES